MKLISGLGNPSEKYKNTRHNVGFMAIDCYLQSVNKTLTNHTKFQSHLAIINNAIFAKPQTYMNNSGIAIEKIINYYKINDILVIHDDLDLNLGTTKIKLCGNDGGHNGLKSINNHTKNKYIRLRIGIDHPRNTNENISVIDYVLQKFDKRELEILKKVFVLTNNAIESFINNESIENLQNKYNKRI